MDLATLVAWAARQQASDLHLESGLPLALRVRGGLRTEGEPLSAATIARLLEPLLDEAARAALERRRSADLAVTLSGVRCRINVLYTSGGPGAAVRLLPDAVPTLDSLNLHPDLTRLVDHPHGLLLVSGPTGCGKSSTLAALVQELNLTRACHVVTIEQPVEFDLPPRRAYLRRREVGRDTPSFEQAILDAMRQDPDVLMVGELRERETMRLTLDACETGHLVLATLHSATAIEALQRIVSAFPALEQPSVCAQLADVLVGVVTQRLLWREDLLTRVPECEILLGTSPVRAIVRSGQLFKLTTALETGGGSGQWTRERYRAWMERRTDWHLPSAPAPREPAPRVDAAPPAAVGERAPAPTPRDDEQIIVLHEEEQQSLRDILRQLEREE